MKYLSLALWIVIISVTIFEANSACELKLKNRVRLESDEQFAGPLLKFADDTIYFPRQNTREYVFMKPNGSYKIYLPPSPLFREPTLLKNGNLLFSSHKGELIELNSNAEIVRSIFIAPKALFGAVVEWDEETWFLSKTDGKILSSKPFDSNTTQIFDLNADVSNPDDYDGYFKGPVNYKNQYLVITPALSGKIRILDKNGTHFFEFTELKQNPFQNPLILKDGKILAAGKQYGTSNALISIVDPNSNFHEEQISFGTNTYTNFVMQRKDGGFVVANVAVNEEQTSFEQHLLFYDQSWVQTSKIITTKTGYDLTWKSVQLADGHIINGVKDTIQLISPDHKIVSTYTLPNVAESRTYQAVDGDPVVLSDETIVYLGDSTEVYFLKKECNTF